MNFTTIDCDMCGSEDYHILFRGKDLLMDLPGTFQFVECAKCGLLRQNPRLEWVDLLAYYQDGYVPHLSQVKEGDSMIRSLVKRYGRWKRVRYINKYKSQGRWLDVGCGTGRILQEAQIWGKWELFGLEPVKEIADYTENRLGIHVFPKTFEQFNDEREKFDIITMWDVLEHLPSPTASLKHVSHLLKDDGIFVFSIPNAQSLDRKIFNKFWVGYDLPRHLYVFPWDVLEKMVEEAGMMVVSSKCIAGTYASFILSLSFYNRVTQSKILNMIVNRRAGYSLLRVISMLPFWMIDKLKLSTNITFVVQKQKKS